MASTVRGFSVPPASSRVIVAVATLAIAAEKLMALCFDMEEALNEAFDATHATHLIGHGLREFANEPEARAVASTAWLACQKVEALQQIWRDLFKAAAQATR
jgi:hypothetical protein